MRTFTRDVVAEVTAARLFYASRATRLPADVGLWAWLDAADGSIAAIASTASGARDRAVERSIADWLEDDPQEGGPVPGVVETLDGAAVRLDHDGRHLHELVMMISPRCTSLDRGQWALAVIEAVTAAYQGAAAA